MQKIDCKYTKRSYTGLRTSDEQPGQELSMVMLERTLNQSCNHNWLKLLRHLVQIEIRSLSGCSISLNQLSTTVHNQTIVISNSDSGCDPPLVQTEKHHQH